MKITKKILMCIAAMMMFLACKKDNTLMYNNMTMAQYTKGQLYSDQGNYFNIVENISMLKMNEDTRYMILCDVLNKVEGTENVYDVRLTDARDVLVKKPLAMSSIVNEEEKVEDPIGISQLWISGGYVNMLVGMEYEINSKEKHLINFVFDEEASKDSTYVFTLRHNLPEIKEGAETALGYNYVSFPVEELINKDEATIKINWKWYKDLNLGWSSEIQEYTVSRPYKKAKAEPAPATIKSKSVNLK